MSINKSIQLLIDVEKLKEIANKDLNDIEVNTFFESLVTTMNVLADEEKLTKRFEIVLIETLAALIYVRK